MKMTRLLLVDDHQIVLDSLQLLFAGVDTVEVVGLLNQSELVLPFVRDHAVDVLICDMHMPRQSGLELTLQLRRHHPALKVLLLTMAEDAATIREAVRAGVSGYVLKRSGRTELEKAITLLMQGQRYFSSEVLEQLVRLDESGTDEHNPLTSLTEREVDVLRLIADEHPTHQIAQKLYISVPTVETHRRHLMQKLGVKSVVGMVKFAMKHGLVS
jgi:DNA-binding NarL/FixJ family response regulator